MNKIIEIYDLYCKTINNCYFYKEKKDEKHLLNEIGVLRGLEQTLKIQNMKSQNMYNCIYQFR